MIWTAFLAASSDEWKLLDPQMVDYLRLLLVLGAVLIMAYLGVRYLLPKLTGIRQAAQGPMRVVARMPLEPGKNLYVVQAGPGSFLVGTSANGIHFLAALDAAEPLGAPVDAKTGEFAGLMESRQGAKE